VPPPPAFRYVEVWPPNDAWRHLEALLGRSAGPASSGGVLALYPPVWGGERGAALRTVALCEAVTTMLGAGVLVLGDDGGALRHPYYPDYERLERAEREQLLEWHRFALRCRDLFRQGPGTSSHDTSWVDVGDENGAVRVVTDGPQARPEPAGGGLFARVVRDGPLTAVACLDLTGSSGSWQEPTWRGTVRQARVELLVERPERCHAEVAALGSGGGRFAPVELVPASHREGRAVAISMPLGDGWAVARIDEGR
ncbi:MAG TPA: glycoside hydrolase family 66 protein, partial [Acidimicrobiales bacterium]|nr:glycoside hydrolase family 66 protein [Acidimicrobiales bacterium]